MRSAIGHPLAPTFDVPDEVSEFEGALLVRLGRGSAMQVRLLPERDSVSIRIVPMAKATKLGGDAPWHAATDAQLRSWIQSDSAIWRWLMAKGVDGDTIEERLSKSAPPAERRSRRPAFLTLRPKRSLSLP
jgi:hypothetical protein